MKNFALTFFERLLLIFFTLLFLQLPLFIVQYEQQLTGRVEELKWEVGHMEKAARKIETTLALYIEKFKNNCDSAIADQGLMMEKIERRFNRLSRGLLALNQATAWNRSFKFFYYFESDVALSTWKAFTPGIPLSWGGLLYGLTGMCFGLFVFRLIPQRKNR